MNFASKHVYAYDHSDEEIISDTELEEGMYLSLSDSGGSGDELHVPRAASNIYVSSEPMDHGDEQRVAENRRSNLVPVQEEAAAVAISRPQLPPRLTRRKKRVRWNNAPTGTGRQIRRADTNIITVKFDKLKEPSHMHTGDAVMCSQCQASFSHLSCLSDSSGDASDEGSKVWVCEFCSQSNVIDLVTEEIPTEEDVTYMLEPASLAAEGAAGGSGDEALVVFCIDVSGSMCVTTEIPGRFVLRGADRNRANPGGDEFEAYQEMAGMRRDVTYISRLQGVQAAVDKQLETMKKTFPQRGIALVSFNNEVTVIGDGSQAPTVIAGDKLNDKDALVKLGKEVGLPQAIGKVGDALSAKVFSLEEGGATALGPALLFSVMMASQRPGSKVIICTDGLANVGLGSLDELVTDEQHELAQQFYDELGQLAVDAGVSVSVVTIEGTDCRMVELGQVADKTGGQVNVVDPMKLTQEFGNMLANPVIATNVTATLILHSGLYFRNEEGVNNKVTRHVGNVTADSEISFEFGVRSKTRESSPATDTATDAEKQPEVKVVVTDEDKERGEQEADREGGEQEAASASASSTAEESSTPKADGEPSVTSMSELPFQLQIQYIGMDGSKSLRVISKSQPVTKDRELAERDLDVGVIGVHAAQTAAYLAMQGNYTLSRISTLGQQRLVQRWSHQSGNRAGYVNWVANVAPMEMELHNVQQRERTTVGRSYSDDEEDDDAPAASGLVPLPPAVPARVQSLGTAKSEGYSGGAKKLATKKALNRRRECSDETATMMYRMRATSSKSFTDPSATVTSKQTDPKSGGDKPKESSV